MFKATKNGKSYVIQFESQAAAFKRAGWKVEKVAEAKSEAEKPCNKIDEAKNA